MIIHSTAITALFTATYLMVQGALNPGAVPANSTDKETPPGIQQAASSHEIANDIVPEAITVAAPAVVTPVMATNVIKMGRQDQAQPKIAKQEIARKKVIVIGRNTVSVKYVSH